MSIESRIPLEQINIKDLSTKPPEGKTRPRFDAESEITPEQWDQIQTQLEREQPLSKILHQASVKISLPSKFESIKMNETAYNEMFRRQVQLVAQVDNRTQAAGALKIMFPDKHPGLHLRTVDVDQLLRWIKDGNDFYAYYFKLLQPLEDINKYFDAKSKNKVLERLKECYRQCSGGSQSWSDLTNDLSRTKLIFPDVAKQVPLTDDDWKKIISRVKGYNLPQEAGLLVDFLAGLKILAAKQARITEQGIELSEPEETTFKYSSITALPETKKF